MRRLVIFLWLLLVLVWIGTKFGVREWLIKRMPHAHVCAKEWRSPPESYLHESDYICTETGENLGFVYENSGIKTWHASSAKCAFYLTRDFNTEEEAKRAVEACQ